MKLFHMIWPYLLLRTISHTQLSFFCLLFCHSIVVGIVYIIYANAFLTLEIVKLNSISFEWEIQYIYFLSFIVYPLRLCFNRKSNLKRPLGVKHFKNEINSINILYVVVVDIIIFGFMFSESNLKLEKRFTHIEYIDCHTKGHVHIKYR